jgi:hypothetical protein
MGGKDAVDRFLDWKSPPTVSSNDEDAAAFDNVEDDG